MSQWKRIDESHRITHVRNDDICIYAREYHGGGQGYNAGETNQLILNFKKSPTKKTNTNEWYYRERDVMRFATEASVLFKPEVNYALTAVPSSKASTDPEYDNRFEDMLRQLVRLRPNLVIEWPISVRATQQAAHRGGSRRPEEIIENYVWNGFANGVPETLFVFDDVVTTGSHFRAASDFLRANGFTGRIVGTFWARTLHPPPLEFTIIQP